MQIQAEIEQLQAQLQAQADPARAAGEQQYLKSDLNFYGVAVPALRKMAKAWLKTHADTPIERITGLARALWDSDWHEEKTLAILLLQHRVTDLTPDDLPLVEHMMQTVNTWAHLDEIAIRVVGGMIDQQPDLLQKLPGWAISDQFWVRRTAILAQILQFRRGAGDTALFEQIAVPMFAEGADWSKEERFFIRKAIGWALRELAKTQPETVFQFVRQYRDQMAGLTFREATRKLPASYQQQLAGE